MGLVPLAVLGLLLSTAGAQVIQWDIEKRHDSPRLQRRSDSTFEAPIKNDKRNGGYFATVQIGSPGQNLTLQIDTGSSDVWVPYSGASICTDTSSDNDGCTFGSCTLSFNRRDVFYLLTLSVVDPDESKTFDDVGPGQFEIAYVDNSYSRGDYFQDDLKIAGATIQNLTMGLGVRTNIAHGLIGLGYVINEASMDTVDATYPNLPVAMEQGGLINTVAYSLWLNDLDANTGSILFGGIDTAKYVGDLTRIEILPDESNDNFTHFTVAVTSLEASSPSGMDVLTSEELPIHAVLDSGTTLTYLPQDMASQVWAEMGAEYALDFEAAVLPCSFRSHPGQFSFGFAGPQGPRINITMDEIVIDLTDGQPPTFTSGPHKGEPVCGCGIQNQSSSPYFLGDTFLRSAYVVYDLVNNEIGLAATDFNSTESNIVPFKSNGAAIPSATKAPDQVDDAETPGPTQTNLSAADGFQNNDDDSMAAPLTVSAGPGIMVAGLATLFALVDGWSPAGQWL